jgi:tetratricopeptide (TPR) repeat protein
MKPSTELFDLVKSLTKSEKRFFKLSSSLQSGEKNYLKIFDVIDRQKTYDEDAIKEQFKKEIFIKHFPSEKNHLYKLILKSLRSYHSDNSVSSILKQEIKNIEILYRKALFRECNKFLARAKKIAIEREKFYYWFELISWEKLLLEEAYEAGEFTTDLDALIKEEQEVIEKLRNLAAYHVLYSKINYVFRSGGYVRNDKDRGLVEEISHHPLIIGRNTALSYRAATICYYIQGFCAMATVDKESAYVKFMRVKGILDSKPLVRDDLPKRYILTLSSLLRIQIDTGRIDEALEMIQMMRKVSKKSAFASEDIALRVFKSTYLAEMRIYEKKGEYEKAIVNIEFVVNGLDYNEGKMNKEQELLFLNTISTVYFGAGRYKESLQWLNRVLNDNEPNLRQDLYSYARLFNLVVHFELGNYDLLEYIIKSTTRYLSKRERDHDLEVVILNYMKRLVRGTQNSDLHDIFVEFKEELTEQLSRQNDEIILDYFNFIIWIDSKLKGIPFDQATKDHYELTMSDA